MEERKGKKIINKLFFSLFSLLPFHGHCGEKFIVPARVFVLFMICFDFSRSALTLLAQFFQAQNVLFEAEKNFRICVFFSLSCDVSIAVFRNYTEMKMFVPFPMRCHPIFGKIIGRVSHFIKGKSGQERQSTIKRGKQEGC
jgi:hypothetical protein